MLEGVFGRRRRERESAEAAERSETSAEVGGSSASGSRSSNKMGGRRKRKKRRKKLPKTSSSTSTRRRAVNQGTFKYAENEEEDEVMIEYEQRAGVLRIHTADTCTLHAEPLNSVHCKEVWGYLEEIIKLIEEKVIMEDMEEENNHKNGTPAANMYSDRTHTYITCWPD